MSSDATDNTMRAAFEKWAHEFELEPAHGARARLGCVYEDVATNAAFAGWQAASADTARQVELAVAAEREAILPVLITVLGAMERDWHQIDGEWGPCGKTLDQAVATGYADEIGLLRAAIRARSTPSTSESKP